MKDNDNVLDMFVHSKGLQHMHTALLSSGKESRAVRMLRRNRFLTALQASPSATALIPLSVHTSVGISLHACFRENPPISQPRSIVRREKPERYIEHFLVPSDNLLAAIKG